jgi:hypothetical protein
MLSAGEARAELRDGFVTCQALNGAEDCLPAGKDLFNDLPSPYTVSATGGDPLFTITANETEINLTFTEFATGDRLDNVGFALHSLSADPDLVPGELDVSFLGDWSSLPVSRPKVEPDLESIEWFLLTNATPSTGAIARINVPEPGRALLAGVSLTVLTVLRRSRRGASRKAV